MPQGRPQRRARRRHQTAQRPAQRRPRRPARRPAPLRPARRAPRRGAAAGLAGRLGRLQGLVLGLPVAGRGRRGRRDGDALLGRRLGGRGLLGRLGRRLGRRGRGLERLGLGHHVLGLLELGHGLGERRRARRLLLGFYFCRFLCSEELERLEAPRAAAERRRRELRRGAQREGEDELHGSLSLARRGEKTALPKQLFVRADELLAGDRGACTAN